MKQKSYYLDKLSNLSLEQVKHYLLNKGWIHEKDFPNANLLVFYNKAEEINVTISSNEKFKDYSNSLFETLKILVEVEDREFIDILNEIQRILIDKLSLRIMSEYTKHGVLPIIEASEIVIALKDIILTTSCNEAEPRPFYHKCSKQGNQYCEQFNFAQTQVGSFIFNIETLPIEYDNQITLNSDGTFGNKPLMPVSRKIIERINNSFQQLDNAVKNDSIDSILLDGYINGINANMCDSILKIIPHYNDKAENMIDINFSPILPVEKQHTRFIVKKTYEPILKAISEAYKKDTKEYNVNLVGYAKSLASENPISDDSDKIVGLTITNIIDNISETENITNCQMSLNKEQYYTIMEYHKGNIPVIVNGVLRKIKNRWWLEEIQNIKAFNNTI